jgi:hypothetical protein
MNQSHKLRIEIAGFSWRTLGSPWTTRLILDGQDISGRVSEIEIHQTAGERAEITIKGPLYDHDEIILSGVLIPDPSETEEAADGPYLCQPREN